MGKIDNKVIQKGGKKGDTASDISSASTAAAAAAHGKATDLGSSSDIHVFQANGRWFMVNLPC